jgi:rRNA maturation protein Rpf1
VREVSNLPLSRFKSLCQKTAKTIVSQDSGTSCIHIANNIERSFVTHYKIDGEVITEGMRCDFLLINEDKRIAYLIELKGRDLTKAAKQLLKTEETLKYQLQSYSLRYRIIASKCHTQEIRSSSFNKFRIQKGEFLRFGTNEMEENI